MWWETAEWRKEISLWIILPVVSFNKREPISIIFMMVIFLAFIWLLLLKCQNLRSCVFTGLTVHRWLRGWCPHAPRGGRHCDPLTNRRPGQWRLTSPGWRLVSVSSVAAVIACPYQGHQWSVHQACTLLLGSQTSTIARVRSPCWSPSWSGSSCSWTPATPWQRWRCSTSWSWSGRPGRSSPTSTGGRWPYDRSRSWTLLSDKPTHNHEKNQNIQYCSKYCNLPVSLWQTNANVT